MRFSTKSRAKLVTLAGALVFSVAGTGIVHADDAEPGFDMSDSVAAGDSGAVRDTDSPNRDESIKQRWKDWEKGTSTKTTPTKTAPKHDNSRYNTDGTETYDNDEGYEGRDD